MATFSTPDLCDENEGLVQVVDPRLKNFGATSAFFGEIVTIKCFEDNSLVKTQAARPGNGRVMVVDGGGSTRRALLGDMIAANAVENNWAGIVIWGSVRDVDVLAELKLGIQALGAIPVKTEKRGLGDLNVPVTFGNVTFRAGDWIYADNNGVIVAEHKLTP